MCRYEKGTLPSDNGSAAQIPILNETSRQNPFTQRGVKHDPKFPAKIPHILPQRIRRHDQVVKPTFVLFAQHTIPTKCCCRQNDFRATPSHNSTSLVNIVTSYTCLSVHASPQRLPSLNLPMCYHILFEHNVFFGENPATDKAKALDNQLRYRLKSICNITPFNVTSYRPFSP